MRRCGTSGCCGVGLAGGALGVRACGPAPGVAGGALSGGGVTTAAGGCTWTGGGVTTTAGGAAGFSAAGGLGGIATMGGAWRGGGTTIGRGAAGTGFSSAGACATAGCAGGCFAGVAAGGGTTFAAGGVAGLAAAAGGCCFCRSRSFSSLSTSPGLEILERSIFGLISGAAPLSLEAELDLAEKYFLTLSASSSSMELEWVFFSVMPTSFNASRMALLFTSSSLARSLIRIFIRCVFPPDNSR